MYLSERKYRLNLGLALVVVAAIALGFILLVWSVKARNPQAFWILMGINALVSYNIFRSLTRKVSERRAMLKREFPEAWRQILQRDVAFYRALSPEEQKRFEAEILVFLHEVRITGVKTEVDDRTMVLAAASAEIPVFSFPDWEYPNLGEILIYPNAFSYDFRTEGEGRQVWGMVGTGAMNGLMILSQPALIAGFENNQDKINVGVHEFAHLIDGADGEFDGIPKLFLEHRYLEPWLSIMHYETKRINEGKSKMNPYAATKPVEFFAVATEYFFEHPQAMKRNKPELYELMTKIFQQDTGSLLRQSFRDMLNLKAKKIGRNEPCPCQSGQKYKDCCLRNARMVDADPMAD